MPQIKKKKFLKIHANFAFYSKTAPFNCTIKVPMIFPRAIPSSGKKHPQIKINHEVSKVNKLTCTERARPSRVPRLEEDDGSHCALGSEAFIHFFFHLLFSSILSTNIYVPAMHQHCSRWLNQGIRHTEILACQWEETE